MEKMVEHMKKRGTSEPEIIRRLIIEEKEGKFTSEFDYILTVKEGGLAEEAQKIKEKLKNYESKFIWNKIIKLNTKNIKKNI